MRKLTWRIVVPALVTVGLAAGTIPALAGELDNDKVDNPAHLLMTLRCKPNGAAELKFTVNVAKGAKSMTASWEDITVGSAPFPATREAQARRVHRDGNTAHGTFRLPLAVTGHRILVVVDAWAGPNGTGNFLNKGRGRNVDTVRCAGPNPPPPPLTGS